MAKHFKICLVFLHLALLIYNCEKLSAQTSILEKKYSLTFPNISFESVIDTLRKAIDYGISYNPEILPQYKIVNLSFKAEPLKVILDSILQPLQLSYKLVNRNIIIVRPSTPKASAASITADTLKFVQLNGRVYNKKTNEPIPFVNIYIKNKNIGTISNNDGNFIFKVPLENADDSVYFSSIGYVTLAKRINGLQVFQNLILLDEIFVKIKEVTVNYIDAKTIIKRAIDKISTNFSNRPLMLNAFYRETIKQNRDYVGLSEAILHIFKASYRSYGGDQVIIFKGRKSPFVKQMDTLSFKFQGGISTCLLLDIAKNPSNFLADEFIDSYDYKLDDIINIEDRTTYVIAFDQKDNIQYPLYKGKIYIDKETLAIVRVDFMLSPKGIEYATSLLVRKSPRGVKVKPVTSNYVVNYSRHHNTWYLNYIREEAKFKVHKRFYFGSTLFNLTAEMVITRADSVNVQHFKASETVKTKDIFVEKIGKYDESFWGDFNFIPPDESLEEAISKIKEKARK
jgi:CarboxypepD_reg-like domain